MNEVEPRDTWNSFLFNYILYNLNIFLGMYFTHGIATSLVFKAIAKVLKAIDSSQK